MTQLTECVTCLGMTDICKHDRIFFVRANVLHNSVCVRVRALRALRGGGRGGEGRIFPSPPPPLSFSQSSSPLGSLLTRSSPLHVFLSKMAAATRERRIIQPSRPTKYACTVGYIRSCFFNGKNQSSHLIHIFQTQGVRGHRHPRTPSPCHAPGK